MTVTIIGWVLIGVFGIDMLHFFIRALTNIPTSLTEWICYPFYPIIPNGLGMFTSVIIRALEILGIIAGEVLLN